MGANTIRRPGGDAAVVRLPGSERAIALTTDCAERLTEVDPAKGLSSGLGLSLAKQIIVDAGGQLWYEDREGGGARFVIELPEADPGAATS